MVEPISDADRPVRSRDWRDEYWEDCISEAADKCALSLAPEQLSTLAVAVKNGHENYSMASGDDVASANLWAHNEREMADLRKELHRERAKVICKTCKGAGMVIQHAGPWVSRSSCYVCHGTGKVDP